MRPTSTRALGSIALALTLLSGVVLVLPATAAPPANDPFQRTWQRTDKPVADGQATRTWMWGPEAFTDAMPEPYAESPNGERQVQYFDKSRMEITNPGGDANSIWYVTNGLLVRELVTGQMQTGDTDFEPRAAAQVNVAGDPDDATGPTYATFGPLQSAAAHAGDVPITATVNRAGDVGSDASKSGYGVTADILTAETGHRVASVFWQFMNTQGTVYENGQFVNATLFQNPYYATGYPIAEAYWATVKVGGQQRDVLMQCFERRCLTYTPANPTEWQVEMGNVGQHYYAWRYAQSDVDPGPSEHANQLAATVLRARDDAARIHALMDVLAALNVGVYTGDGQQILGGAERGAGDFYLYDIEVHMMSEAIERGQTYGLIDLAIQLTAMGLLPEGHTLDPALVRQALLTVTQQAASDPANPGSLVPLLARQLGLAQGYDLLVDTPLDTERFDPLSYFLLLSGVAIPLIDDQLPIEGGMSNLVAESNGILKSAKAETPCDPPSQFQGDAFKNTWGWSKNFAELLGLVSDAVGSVTAIIDAVHGAVLAFSVGVTALDDRLETHYGPSGHESDASQPITFRIKVEMRDELPRALIDCGWIAGTDFPPKGPIEDVSVHWFWDNLDDHGQINCGNVCGQTPGNGLAIDATGPDGIATMTFQPKDEVNPDEGWIDEEHGIVTGVALYQSKFGNLLGSYAQYLTPKSGATRWVVKWHEVPGWDVEMKVTYNVKEHDSGNWYNWSTGTMTFTGRITAVGFGDDNEQSVFPASTSGSGSGSYGYTHNPPVDCSWSGSWKWDQNAVLVLNREQLIVDFAFTLGWMPVNPGTSHPTSGDCEIGWDQAISVAGHPPAFSLMQQETQVIEVAPPAAQLDTGSITWEITVTPITQP